MDLDHLDDLIIPDDPYSSDEILVRPKIASNILTRLPNKQCDQIWRNFATLAYS